MPWNPLPASLHENKKVLVIRNGWFSYRWTQIFNQGVTPEHAEIVMAQPDTDAKDQQFSPTPIDDICAKIKENAPRVVVSPHVETSAGILMPDEYLKKIADTAHEVGAIFVLDCVASGALWVDMKTIGVDVLITAPKKAGLLRHVQVLSCFLIKRVTVLRKPNPIVLCLISKNGIRS